MDGRTEALSENGRIFRRNEMTMLLYFSMLLLAAIGLQGAPPPKAVNDGYGDFVLVPAGRFKMGDNFGDGESRERPVHTVELDRFYIGKYEVTNGDWKRFVFDQG